MTKFFFKHSNAGSRASAAPPAQVLHQQTAGAHKRRRQPMNVILFIGKWLWGLCTPLRNTNNTTNDTVKRHNPLFRGMLAFGWLPRRSRGATNANRSSGIRHGLFWPLLFFFFGLAPQFVQAADPPFAGNFQANITVQYEYVNRRVLIKVPTHEVRSGQGDRWLNRLNITLYNSIDEAYSPVGNRTLADFACINNSGSSFTGTCYSLNGATNFGGYETGNYTGQSGIIVPAVQDANSNYFLVFYFYPNDKHPDGEMLRFRIWSYYNNSYTSKPIKR